MDYKPDEQTLIAWLYDELDDVEREKVERYLELNPDKKEELRQLAKVREVMRAVEDKEVIIPPLFGALGAKASLWQSSWFRIPIGIAASLVVLLLGARLVGLQVTYQDHRLTMDFGQVKTKPLTEDAVQSMINSSLAENNQTLKANWEQAHQELAESIRQNLVDDRGMINAHIGKLVSQASQASQDQIRAYASSLQERDQEAIKDYMQLTTSEQKDYLEGLLVDFAKYLQEQRNQDLKTLQTRLDGYEQDNSSFKKETEQILSGIIAAAQTPEKTEKN